jgi:hypothetical protein
VAKVYRRPKLYAEQTATFFEPLDGNGNPDRYLGSRAAPKSRRAAFCMAWLVEQSKLKGKPGFW